MQSKAVTDDLPVTSSVKIQVGSMCRMIVIQIYTFVQSYRPVYEYVLGACLQFLYMSKENVVK